MASNAFRDSMNSLGWSRRDNHAPVSNAASNPSFTSRLQSLNPFASGGYVQLPTHETAPGAPLPAPSRREEEEGFFARKSELFILTCLSFLCGMCHGKKHNPRCDGLPVPACPFCHTHGIMHASRLASDS